MSIKQLKNLQSIYSKYDVLFVDLWGVIHDGIEPYSGVHEALQAVKESGTKIIFVSNAPRRAQKAVEGLRRFGINDELYDGIMTSGEVVFKALVNSSLRGVDPEFISGEHNAAIHTKESVDCRATPLASLAMTNKYIIIGPERDAGLLDGTDYIKVESVADAEFMIVTGFDNDDSTMAEKQHYLDEAIKLDMPLICANPDLIVVRKSGKEALCAGVIAKKYEDMGGKVLSFGKPHRPIYEQAMELAGNPDKSRVAAIGDSLITDILGANDFGIASYLIPGGILGAELGIKHGELPDTDKLQQLCNRYNITPTGVLPEFTF